MSDSRAYAKRVLRFYMRNAYEKSTLPWNHDNNQEMDALVDAIVDAAVQEIARQLNMQIVDKTKVPTT